jgi:hypothetical protein
MANLKGWTNDTIVLGRLTLPLEMKGIQKFLLPLDM